MAQSGTQPASKGWHTFNRIRSFVTSQPRSVHVLLIGLVVMLLAGGVAHFVFSDWLIWFWAVTVIAVFELLAIALIDLLADVTGRLPRLITDQAAPWSPRAQAALVPGALLLGIVIDHLLVH